MKISNQKPVRLEPVYTDPFLKPFDPVSLLKETMAEPLFTPKIQTIPVTMTENGTDVTSDDIAELLLRCCKDNIDIAAESVAKDVLADTTISYDRNTHLAVSEFFAVQSGTAAGLDEPDDNTVYTPGTDVIPVSREFLAGQKSYDEFFASLAYFARVDTLGFYFCNSVAFDEFKAFVAAQMNMLGSGLPAETCRLFADFQNLTLNGLTESLLLRTNDSEANDPGSFARVLVSLLMTYTAKVSSAEFGVLPFSVAELFCPKTVVFVNVEQHGRATSRAVNAEWKLINKSIATKPAMLKMSRLNKLTATARALNKLQKKPVASAASLLNVQKAAQVRFSKTRPTNINLTRAVKRVLDKMGMVNRSMNIVKRSHKSFAKANRRDPDDYNKMGLVTKTSYKPDIHLYIDTSGSISERDYEDAVKACIKMAKKFNVNMYFNSFSHCMSQTTKLHLADKSTAAVYREFQKIPKVTGGTNYDQIWSFINSSKKRSREFSLMITDFEYYPPRRAIHHPKNLYYAPCSNLNWDMLKRAAEEFCKSMLHSDPNFRKHMLF